MHRAPVLSLVGVLFLPSTAASAAKGPSEPPSFEKAYARVRQDEKAAVDLLAELSQKRVPPKRLTAPAARAAKRANEAPPPRRLKKDLEEALFRRDTEENGAIRELYLRALAAERPGSEQLRLRAALLHWTILLRRQAMGPLKTAVPGLESDPRCEGDVIQDGLFLKYFDALFGDTPGADGALAMKALGALARQSACLGTRQSAYLAHYLEASFLELRAFLRLNGQESLVPAVAQALSSPFLLFYDVEKYRGGASPLTRWFLANRDALKEGVRLRRLPAVWHGLWLYDRRHGWLVGYRHSLSPRDENEVNLNAFLDSIVSPENLGTFGCGFSEMVMRPPSADGYLCAAAACAPELRGTTPTYSAVSPSTTTLTTLGALGGGHTAWSGHTASLTCPAPSSSGAPAPAGGREDRGALCGNPTRIGDDRFLSALMCAAELSSGTRGLRQSLRCIAEGTGHCSNPVDAITKELTEASYAGVLAGPSCGRMAPAEGAATATPAPSAGPSATPSAQPTATPSASPATPAPTATPDPNSDAEKLKKAREDVEDAKGAETEAAKDVIEALKDLKNADSMAARNDATARLEAALEAKDFFRQETKNAETRLKDLLAKLQGLIRPCNPNIPGCQGNDDCTAMSDAMLQTMKCVMNALFPKEPPEDPTVVASRFDPDDPSAADRDKRAQCFESLKYDGVATKLESQCWLMRCANGQVATQGPGGTCQCETAQLGGTTGAGALGLCSETIHCTGESYQDGCSCVPYGETPPGALGASRGGFSLPPVPQYGNPMEPPD